MNDPVLPGVAGTGAALPTGAPTDAHAVGGARPVAPDARLGLAMNPGELMRRAEERFAGVDRSLLEGAALADDLNTTLPRWRQEAFAQAPERGAVFDLGTPDRPRLAPLPMIGVSGVDRAGKVRDYILAGERLYRQILADQSPPPSKTNLAHLMWYLQALAAAKANETAGGGALVGFEKGAFVLADPGHRLENWLHRFNVYPRASSHLRDFQRQRRADEADYAFGVAAYGLDIRGVETPREQRTLLIQRMPTCTAAAARPDGANGVVSETPLLFLKMEEHGCRGLFSTGGTGELPDQPVSFGHKLKRFFANLADFAGHALHFLVSLGRDPGHGFREYVDGNLLADYRGFLQAFAPDGALAAPPETPLADRRRQVGERLAAPGFDSRTGGVRLLHARLDAALQLARAEPADAILIAALERQQSQLRRMGDHPELRQGREIILLPDEMFLPQCQPLRRLDETPGRHCQGGGERRAEYLALDVAGWTYTLASQPRLDRALQCFRSDALRGSQFLIDGVDPLVEPPQAAEPPQAGEPPQAADPSQAPVLPLAADARCRLAVEALAGAHEAAADVRLVSDSLLAMCSQAMVAPLTTTLVEACLLHEGLWIMTSDVTPRFEIDYEAAASTETRHVYRLNVSMMQMAPPLNTEFLQRTYASTPGSWLACEQSLRFIFDAEQRAFALEVAPGGATRARYDVTLVEPEPAR